MRRFRGDSTCPWNSPSRNCTNTTALAAATKSRANMQAHPVRTNPARPIMPSLAKRMAIRLHRVEPNEKEGADAESSIEVCTAYCPGPGDGYISAFDGICNVNHGTRILAAAVRRTPRTWPNSSAPTQRVRRAPAITYSSTRQTYAADGAYTVYCAQYYGCCALRRAAVAHSASRASCPGRLCRTSSRAT